MNIGRIGLLNKVAGITEKGLDKLAQKSLRLNNAKTQKDVLDLSLLKYAYIGGDRKYGLIKFINLRLKDNVIVRELQNFSNRFLRTSLTLSDKAKVHKIKNAPESVLNYVMSRDSSRIDMIEGTNQIFASGDSKIGHIANVQFVNAADNSMIGSALTGDISAGSKARFNTIDAIKASISDEASVGDLSANMLIVNGNSKKVKIDNAFVRNEGPLQEIYEKRGNISYETGLHSGLAFLKNAVIKNIKAEICRLNGGCKIRTLKTDKFICAGSNNSVENLFISSSKDNQVNLSGSNFVTGKIVFESGDGVVNITSENGRIPYVKRADGRGAKRGYADVIGGKVHYNVKDADVLDIEADSVKLGKNATAKSITADKVELTDNAEVGDVLVTGHKSPSVFLSDSAFVKGKIEFKHGGGTVYAKVKDGMFPELYNVEIINGIIRYV